jgi:hypothetical protein
MGKKLKRIEEIDGYSIIRGWEDCPTDPEQTRAAVEAAVQKNPELAKMDLEKLFEMYEVLSENLGPGKKHFTEADDGVLEGKFDTLQEKQLLTETLEVVADFRGVEYWKLENTRWSKIKIEHIGETVPSGAFLPEALTGEQQAEIAAQGEADRIAALSPDEKEAEKQAKIKAVMKEALARKQEAEFEAEVNDTPMEFDSVAWAQEQKAQIEAKYA